MGEPVTEPQPSDKLELPEKIEHFIGGRHVPSVGPGTWYARLRICA